MSEAFKEDFFERVVDVKWETEPEVFWMVGAGAYGVINGMAGDQHGWIWWSNNGKKFYGKDMFEPDGAGFGPFYTAAWMREGLEIGAPPKWVFGGGSSRLVMTSCVGFSSNGKDFGGRTIFDERHVCELVAMGGSGITFASAFTFPDWHLDPVSTSDGESWTPSNYHGGETDTFAVRTGFAGQQVVGPSFARAPTVKVATSDGLITPTRSLLTPQHQQVMLQQQQQLGPQNFSAGGIPSLMASGQQSVADRYVYIGNAIGAGGRVRKGPYKGQQLVIYIDPYITPPEGGAHGEGTVAVYNKNGRVRDNSDDGLFSNGLQRTMAIGYGHYTFVAVGSSGYRGKKQLSSISWSETGVTWKKVDLGAHNQINAIAVGPRPRGAEDHDAPAK